MGVRCVKCGSHNTAEYLYGLPYMSEELEKNIKDIVFDRAGYIYTGRVQKVAEGARDAGLNF